MKFIVRQGRRRGRGTYLTHSPVEASAVGVWHYTRYQSRACRYESADAARAAARRCWHVSDYRVVRLKERA